MDCKELPNGDLKIVPLEESKNLPEILIGINNIHDEYDEAEPSPIDYFIRPRESYPGGNYGNYGGFDIILIKLKKSVAKKFSPFACLPASKVNGKTITHH